MSPSLREALHQKQAALQTIIDTAKKQKRDLTSAEAANVDRISAEALEIKSQIDESNRKFDQLASARPGTDGGTTYLALAGKSAEAASRRVVTELREAAADHGGSKALLPAGAVVTATPVSPVAVVESGRPALSLLSVIPTIEQDTPTYRVLRQVDFTNNADVVEAGDTKPTSPITLEEVDGSLKVIAHLSEPVSRFWLMDDSNLAGFITRQLWWGLLSKLEEQVINGDGLLGNFEGMLATTGVQAQAFATDALTTLRAAATKLEVLGYEASAFAVSATDWLTITTTRNASGLFDVGGPIDAATQRAWGVPVVVTPNLAPGQAIAFDSGSVLLRYATEGILIDWDQSATLFETNQTRARVEGRFGFDVLRPAGVVVADTTAG